MKKLLPAGGLLPSKELLLRPLSWIDKPAGSSLVTKLWIIYAYHRESVTPSPIAPLLRLSFRMTSPAINALQLCNFLP